MQAFLDEMAQLEIEKRHYALIGNGSWSPTSTKQLSQFFADFKNWEEIAEPITLATALSETQRSEFDELAAAIATSIQTS